MERDTGRTGQDRSLRMRAGMPEKEAHADHIGLAYAAGYLDEDEAAVRREAILRARYADELQDAVRDLPRRADLTPAPAPPRRGVIAGLREDHGVALGVIGALAGALLAAVPAVTIAQMFSPGQVIPPVLIAVDAVTIIAGVFALGAGLIYAGFRFDD